jgi:hypothetical protein
MFFDCLSVTAFWNRLVKILHELRGSRPHDLRLPLSHILLEPFGQDTPRTTRLPTTCSSTASVTAFWNLLVKILHELRGSGPHVLRLPLSHSLLEPFIQDNVYQPVCLPISLTVGQFPLPFARQSVYSEISESTYVSVSLLVMLPNVAVERIALLLHFREVPVSNFSSESD